jgi:membrane associated rhomboid family serine protease
MKFKDKIKSLEKTLVENGEKKGLASPPLFRLFWKLGWNIRPPLFQSFKMNSLYFGGSFTVIMEIIYLFMLGMRSEYHDPLIDIVAAIVSGLVFGLAMAWTIEKKKQKLKLSRWDEFPTKQM